MKKTMISFLAMALGILNFGLAVTMANGKISYGLNSESEVTSKFIDDLNSESEVTSKFIDDLNSESEVISKFIDGLNSDLERTGKSIDDLNCTLERCSKFIDDLNSDSEKASKITNNLNGKSKIIDKGIINLDNAICDVQEPKETTNKNVVASGLNAHDELPTQTITDKSVINLDNATCDGLSNHDTTDKNVVNFAPSMHKQLPTQAITDKSVINLDCTLRDGGYVNDWTFGEKNIPEIRSNLAEAGVDLIECGYFSPFAKEDKDKAVYNSLEELDKILDSHPNAKFCALLRYKEGIEEFIPECTLKNIKLIRISFQYGEAEGAIKLCKNLRQKGYKVSYQPANTPGYSLDELKEMLEMVNELKPYSFYIVDTLGILQKDKLLEMFEFIDKNLAPEISLGYHSHNNLQLAFSNAQTLVGLGTKRKLIIDSSVFGMGRGAGNLCTELFLHHLNEKYGAQYKLEPVYKIFENNISDVYKESPWGYSLPRFISAKNTCSTDYSARLNKRNMKLADMDETLSRLPKEKRTVFNEKALLEVIA